MLSFSTIYGFLCVWARFSLSLDCFFIHNFVCWKKCLCFCYIILQPKCHCIAFRRFYKVRPVTNTIKIISSLMIMALSVHGQILKNDFICLSNVATNSLIFWLGFSSGFQFNMIWGLKNAIDSLIFLFTFHNTYYYVTDLGLFLCVRSSFHFTLLF